MALPIRVRIEGADEVIRALDKLPADAKRAMRDQAKDIATSLADFIKIAGKAESRQAARAASTVREANQGVWPVITASNTGRAKGLLFGSEFGVKGKFGWYAKRRYFGSPALQFKPWFKGSSYWFRRTAEERQPWIQSEWQGAADEVIRRWSA
jgi:hypothetical protein